MTFILFGCANITNNEMNKESDILENKSNAKSENISEEISSIVSKIEFDSEFSEKEIESLKNGHNTDSLDPELVLIDFINNNNLSNYVKCDDNGLVYIIEDQSSTKKYAIVECEETESKIKIDLTGVDIGDKVTAWAVSNASVVA